MLTTTVSLAPTNVYKEFIWLIFGSFLNLKCKNKGLRQFRDTLRPSAVTIEEKVFGIILNILSRLKCQEIQNRKHDLPI